MAGRTTRTTEVEKAEELYAQLKPAAQKEYLDYLMSHTPPELQDEVKTLAAADMAGPSPDPTVATVSNGQSVTVNDSTGAAAPGSPGTAAVADGTLTAVSLGTVARR